MELHQIYEVDEDNLDVELNTRGLELEDIQTIQLIEEVLQALNLDKVYIHEATSEEVKEDKLIEPTDVQVICIADNYLEIDYTKAYRRLDKDGLWTECSKY